MINRVEHKNRQISFSANPAKLNWRLMHGIPARVTSEYTGFTGPKNFDFPTRSDLKISLYPDITKQYNELLQVILDTTNKNLGKNKVVNFFKKCLTLGKNFKTADAWDTKFLEDFPGRSKDGSVQHALLNGEVVTANFVSNCIYAEALAKLKFKKWIGKLGAFVDAHGISNLIFEKKIPTFKNLKFNDTPFDKEVLEKTFNRLSDCK